MTTTVEARTLLCDRLAELLEYPGEAHAARAERAIADLASWRGELRETLAPIAAHVDSLSVAELEEAYTRTFDISPDCALEVGWHLYGENYTRGAFLVEMRGRMRALGLAESAELPDHLTHVLAVIGRLPQQEARQLARDYLLPSLAKMAEKLPADRPHACVLAAIDWVIRELLGIDEVLTAGKEALPYFREIETLPPGCSSSCGGMP